MPRELMRPLSGLLKVIVGDLPTFSCVYNYRNVIMARWILRLIRIRESDIAT